MNEFEQSGGCVCGAVRYTITGAPLVSYACHCADCQTRTGAAFGLATIVTTDAIRVTEGATQKWQRTTNNAAYVWERCTICGTNLYSTIEAAPEITAIWSGTLDDTSWIKPKAHLWTKSAMSWTKFDEPVAIYDEQPEDFAEIFAL